MIERVKEEFQLIYEDEWEEYWEKEDPFHFFDLVGNFKIDWKESERILKDVNGIESSGILA